MVCGFEILHGRHLLNLFFNLRIFFEHGNFAAFEAGEVVMVVLETIAELQLRMPSKLKAADDSELFKYFDIAINGSLIVTAKQGNKLMNSHDLVILQVSE